MDPNGRPAVYGSLFHELVALVALTAAPAMNSMSLGGIQMGLPEVGKSLGMKETELTWLLAAYALMSGSFLLLFGAIADSYGRKKVLLISFIWMALWCLVSGFMENYIVFCVMRGLQGLGETMKPLLHLMQMMLIRLKPGLLPSLPVSAFWEQLTRKASERTRFFPSTVPDSLSALL